MPETFILILSLNSYNGVSIATHEFFDENACKKAKEEFEKRFKGVNGIDAIAIYVKKQI